MPNRLDSSLSRSATEIGNLTGIPSDNRSGAVTFADPPVGNPDTQGYTVSIGVGDILPVISRTFGELLRYAREHSRDPATGEAFTQEELGKLLGKSHSTISAWESGGVANPPIDLINRLAELLPVPVEDWCRALGYRITGMPLADEEREVLMRYRRAARSVQLAVLGGLRAQTEQLQPSR